MFGRVARAPRRLAPDGDLVAVGLVHSYRPEQLAGIAAVGLGTAGFASAGAVAPGRDGTPVSAVSEAVLRALDWGRRAQRRYVRLPTTVLIVIGSDGAHVYGWTVLGAGAEVAHWPARSYTARPVNYLGEIGVEVHLSIGLIALLTARRGPTHRAARRVIRALIELGREPDHDPASPG